MTEIKIHRQQPGIAVLVCPPDACLVSGADAQFFRAMQNPETRALGPHAMPDGARPVGRIVVDEKQVGVNSGRQDAGGYDFHVLRDSL